MITKFNTGLQLLLGLAFVVFGLNKFIGFMPPPELPPAAGAFMGALMETGYMFPLIAVTEIVAGALILSRMFSALGLVILMPISVNIVLFHLALAPAGGVPAYVLAGINVYLLFIYKPKFDSLLLPK
ncbi:DoxX family protein [Puniceicoccales bacterium CK1056]|uniref:DoxX family protein n=1 Tax=Oceanipulchritudo coccoides TaxID=2706888 RepID=A0A6B2M5U5_9BACT|nr:DoxX family protein [Oceanipulchritudo coccoides]NDV63165.1 DoxX family protein [Oceanipulchritudo coccoides]